MDSHPTIDIIETPQNPAAVYNCIDYCFRANDYILVPGALAAFWLDFAPDNYPDGITISVGGKPFKTLTPGGIGSFSWQGTIAAFSQNFVDMLNRDYYFGKNFTNILSFGFPFSVAKKVGAIPGWSLFFPVAVPPSALLSNPGTDIVLRSNYLFVVEIWTYQLFFGTLTRQDLVASRSYEPNPVTGEICIDISKAVRSLVSTTFPGLTGSLSVVSDTNYIKKIGLRYGEVYSDESGTCEALPRWFEDSTPIDIINAAFQRDDLLKIEPFIFDYSGAATRFLTNRPNFSQLCSDSFSWLWYHYDEDLAAFINSDPLLFNFVAFVEFTYTNGSGSEANIDAGLTFDGGVLIVPAGLAQLSSLATPGLIVSSYKITMGLFIGEFSELTPLSETLVFDVADGGFCCCHEEFYFLSEPGGFDTILFNCLREVDLDYSYTEFHSYEPCEGDLLRGGREEAETKAFEIFRTSTRFLDNYQNINWIREFLKSPKRYWRKDGQVYKIMLLNDQVELRRKDGFIYIILEYVLSFELNTQKN